MVVSYCGIVEQLRPPTLWVKTDQTGNLPMTRVKLNARMEYEYLENFKILQKAFVKNRIDKVRGRWEIRLVTDGSSPFLLTSSSSTSSPSEASG